MKEIKNAIDKWVKKNKGEVAFVVSFISFNKKGDVKDDMIGAFGDKECIKLSLNEIQTILKKDKGKFINW